MTQSPKPKPDPAAPSAAKPSDSPNPPDASAQPEPPWNRIQFGGGIRRWAIAVGILLAITTVAAVGHGYFNNRWTKRSGLQEVGDAVSAMSQERLANWEFVREEPISDGVVNMLQTTGFVSRKYRYAPPKLDPAAPEIMISVAVFVGPPGHITAHDPQVCYSAVDYTGLGTRRRINFTDGDNVSQEFWTMSVSHHDESGPPLVVSHAWGTDGTCTAADYPRIAYLGKPYLYKVQLAMPAGRDTDLNKNLSIDFLKEFLPLLRRTIQRAKF